VREGWSPEELPAGVIGLGLMGTSITACLLSSGHDVTAVEINSARRSDAKARVKKLIAEMRREGLVTERVADVMARLRVSGDYRAVADSRIVLEAIVENGTAKKDVLAQVESVVSATTLIGCNSSAIPVSFLQQDTIRPNRILGVHWAEPAHVTRFLEVICGEKSSLALAKRVVAIAKHWRKEPTLVKRDIRGFITNRCFYALLREALHLVEGGYASIADVDRSLRNDLGYWITFAGPFRFMDLTGIPAYETVARDLFPELSNAQDVPNPLAKVAGSGAKGVTNARGFYRYTPTEAKEWTEAFQRFSYEIRALAQRYPEDLLRRNGHKNGHKK
jgi:3-hydroxybutyryl-CoA dehydrogenase